MTPAQRERIQLFQGSLTYRDKRLNGFDAAAVVEVIEHLDPPRLAAFEKVLFRFAAPRAIVITTPIAITTVCGKRCPPEKCATKIIGLNGRERNLRSGRK